MTSYSQYGEDIHILKALEGKTDGRLLDLGAWHATQFSNSRALLEAGWEGLLVECSPGPARGLVQAYDGWDKVKVLVAAVGLDRHCIKIQATDDAVSTSDPATHEKWKHAGGYYGSFYIPTLRLENISHQFGGDFDFINFDTEGTSLELYVYAMEIGWAPKVACVEHDGRIVELAQHAERFGYRQLHLNGTNMVLGR